MSSNLLAKALLELSALSIGSIMIVAGTVYLVQSWEAGTGLDYLLASGEILAGAFMASKDFRRIVVSANAYTFWLLGLATAVMVMFAVWPITP